MEQEHALRRLRMRHDAEGQCQQHPGDQSRANKRHLALPGPWCCTPRARAGIARGDRSLFHVARPNGRARQPAIIMRAWLLVSGLTAACLLAEPTVAQELAPPATGAQPVPGLEEVIVTAQKRPENIQTVPLSILAFSSEALRQLGMTEGFDL